MHPLTLLGPQRLRPTLAAALEGLGLSGKIAAVTAGWQEREAEVEEMREHLGLEVVDLRLHARCEQAFAGDQDLFRAHRERQDRLRKLQRLYRYRLDFAIRPARALLRRKGARDLLEPEREAAIEAVRRLDAEHLERIEAAHREFERRHDGRHPALEKQRDEVAEIVAGASAIAVAGGHVAVLLNRLRLFRFPELVSQQPILAWSAGAMALAERIVLFHDSPPQGAGSAEVLDFGLGLLGDLLPFPHARRRLLLDDRHRVALLARRFAPACCVPLDEGDWIYFDGGRWRPQEPARRLSADGKIGTLEAA